MGPASLPAFNIAPCCTLVNRHRHMQEISTLVSMYLVVSDLRIVMDRRSVRVTAVSPWIWTMT